MEIFNPQINEALIKKVHKIWAITVRCAAVEAVMNVLSFNIKMPLKHNTSSNMNKTIFVFK